MESGRRVEMRERIVRAALETIREQGLAGATARAVAKSGGFNAALIYYYFPSLEDLYIATLEQTSTLRMEAYLERLSTSATIEDLSRAGRELFDEDVRAGHITVLAELMSGAIASPEMGRRIVELMEPWIRLTQDSVARFTRGSMIETMLPARTIAESLVAFYLGTEMLYHLDRDRGRAQRFFDMMTSLLPLIGGFFNAVPNESTDEERG